MVNDILQEMAGILILIQILLTFIFYNFNSEPYLLIGGWLLFIFGLILVMISNNKKWKMKVFTQWNHQLQVGWILVSIALTLISQRTYALLMTISFLLVTGTYLRINKKTIHIDCKIQE